MSDDPFGQMIKDYEEQRPDPKKKRLFAALFAALLLALFFLVSAASGSLEVFFEMLREFVIWDKIELISGLQRGLNYSLALFFLMVLVFETAELIAFAIMRIRGGIRTTLFSGIISLFTLFLLASVPAYRRGNEFTLLTVLLMVVTAVAVFARLFVLAGQNSSGGSAGMRILRFFFLLAGGIGIAAGSFFALLFGAFWLQLDLIKTASGPVLVAIAAMAVFAIWQAFFGGKPWKRFFEALFASGGALLFYLFAVMLMVRTGEGDGPVVVFFALLSALATFITCLSLKNTSKTE